jgi:GTPase SAR1 family protein
MNPLSKIPHIKCAVDDVSKLPFQPSEPLPAKSFCMLVVGAPRSGKTNLILALFVSKKPRYYRGLFDKLFLCSGSRGTLPDVLLKGIPDDQQSGEYSDQWLGSVVEGLNTGLNENACIIIDDCVKDLEHSRFVPKIIMNRRHCCQDASKDGHAGLSFVITSQKYNLLPPRVRSNASHMCLFKPHTGNEIKSIREDVMNDLTPAEQTKLAELVWKEPFSFLYVIMDKPRDQKYFHRFTPIRFD